ncbi:MAG TPA: hypothetical protein VFP50_16910 [Anaeromyxobacteraceae bacterium]|nr:hypothetical protein [Anaeromyxobacteraceae bacterium]
MSTLRSAVLTLLLAAGTAGAAEPTLKPFVLAQRGPGDPAVAVAQVKEKLAAAGFELAGAYDPYPGATVLVVTSPELKAAAAQTPTGGFAAGQRATITQVGDEVQVAFTNPRYVQHAYRLKGDLGPVAQKLEAALGRLEEFGPKDGKSARDLAGYHYMFGMPYYDEPSEIATFGSHEQALVVVEKGLAARRGGASKVYRIDVPGTDQTVFGVSLTDGCGADAHVMKEIDFKPIRSTGHLPYEVLVAGSKVIALHAKFRIAVNFPDLAMMGANSFMNIRCAPDSIEDALKRVAGTKR